MPRWPLHRQRRNGDELGLRGGRKGTRRFGVLLAVEHDGNTVVEAVEPSTDLEGARAILVGRLASGRTDLSKALSVSSNWYADEIFLVLSKPVDDRQMEILKQSAEQTSARSFTSSPSAARRSRICPHRQGDRRNVRGRGR